MGNFINQKISGGFGPNKVEVFNIESGQFNIIRIEDISLLGKKPMSYTRRAYFKISLVTGHSLIHYADQRIEVAENALVFTNPMIPIIGNL